MYVDNDLFLYESDDQITVRCKLQFHKYEIQIQMLPSEIEVVNNEKKNIISVNSDSIIWISTDQGPQARNVFNTSAEIYIKNGDQLIYLTHFAYGEAINDLRKTKTYALAERIAQKMSDKYNIKWEYKYSIDTPQKDKRRSMGLLMIVLLWILMIVVFLLTRKN
ncbi:MAG: hypothetical protein V4592_05225 [Bacteroidota bacterium]